MNRTPCEICGYFNHLTKDCRHQFCEICGVEGHTTYNCRRCIPWNAVPELCATQVEDQSFFFIEEDIDSRVAKEKDCTAIITVVDGVVSNKQIEQEFMFMLGAQT